VIFGVKNNQHIEGRHPMTLIQADLAELLDAIRAGGDIVLQGRSEARRSHREAVDGAATQTGTRLASKRAAGELRPQAIARNWSHVGASRAAATRALVYNRHLSTLGGGERHMFAVAEVLSGSGIVVTPSPVDTQAAVL
jgi:hypothetical protein